MSIPKRFHKPTRLEDFDYKSVRTYFVTIVTRNRTCLLGTVKEEVCELSELGEICLRWWNWLSEQYSYVEMGEFVIMPNHLHAIIRLNSSNLLDEVVQLPLGRIVSAFKAKSTVEINKLQNTPGTKFWQDDFHDRVIRNEEEHNRIVEYIRLNPIRWAEDSENPSSEM